MKAKDKVIITDRKCYIHGAFTYMKDDVAYCASCKEEVPLHKQKNKTQSAAESYAEQFKTGEWFEKIRIESFLAGVEYHKRQPSIGLLPPSEEHLWNEAIGDVIKISTLNKYSVARKLIKDQFYVISKEDAVSAHHSPRSILEYNGFRAEVSLCFSDDILHGKIIEIPDLVNFEAETIDKVKEAFREAVDSYVSTLTEINKNK